MRSSFLSEAGPAARRSGWRSEPPGITRPSRHNTCSTSTQQLLEIYRNLVIQNIFQRQSLLIINHSIPPKFDNQSKMIYTNWITADIRSTNGTMAADLDYIAEFISVNAFKYQIPRLAQTVQLSRTDELVPEHVRRKQ